MHHATKAIAELSGNTLRGAVKNGIRLSYSKNPLGVRTPTSTGGNAGGPTLQQQQQLVQTLHNHHNHHQQFDGSLGHRVDDYGTAAASHRTQAQQTLPRRDTTSSTSSHAQGQHQSFVGGSSNTNNNHNSFLSSPPPRFYSTSPGSGMTYGPPPATTTAAAAASTSTSTPLSGASSAFVPRANGGMFGGHSQNPGPAGNNASWLSSPPSFSPFGMTLAGESYQSHMIPGDHHQHQQQQHQHQHLQSGPAAVDH